MDFGRDAAPRCAAWETTLDQIADADVGTHGSAQRHPPLCSAAERGSAKCQVLFLLMIPHEGHGYYVRPSAMVFGNVFLLKFNDRYTVPYWMLEGVSSVSL